MVSVAFEGKEWGGYGREREGDHGSDLFRLIGQGGQGVERLASFLEISKGIYRTNFVSRQKRTLGRLHLLCYMYRWEV